MIPEYKLFHGAVLAELVDVSAYAISFDELSEPGRLTSYLLNEKIGLHIKHSTSRLPPWQFTLTQSNIEECEILASGLTEVYLAFVCHTDGIVVLNFQELKHLFSGNVSDQMWIKISRGRKKWYSVSASASRYVVKKPQGVKEIIDHLRLG